jgi:hypothetical protein
MSQHCPICGRENPPTSTFCGYCGSTLSDSYADLTELVPPGAGPGHQDARLPAALAHQNPFDENQFKILAPLPEQPTGLPSGQSSLSPEAYSYYYPYPYPLGTSAYDPYHPTPYVTPAPEIRKRGVGELIASILLYLWGMLWASIGLAGGILHDAPLAVIGAVFLATILAATVVLVIVLPLHRQPHLRLGRRLLLELAWLGVALVLGVLSTGFKGFSSSLGDIALGSVFLLYGVIGALMAVW